jgi:hypothetical protein
MPLESEPKIKIEIDCQRKKIVKQVFPLGQPTALPAIDRHFAC